MPRGIRRHPLSAQRLAAQPRAALPMLPESRGSCPPLVGCSGLLDDPRPRAVEPRGCVPSGWDPPVAAGRTKAVGRLPGEVTTGSLESSEGRDHQRNSIPAPPPRDDLVSTQILVAADLPRQRYFPLDPTPSRRRGVVSEVRLTTCRSAASGAPHATGIAGTVPAARRLQRLVSQSSSPPTFPTTASGRQGARSREKPPR